MNPKGLALVCYYKQNGVRYSEGFFRCRTWLNVIVNNGKVTVFGSGLMGSGIAQVAAATSHKVSPLHCSRLND